MDFRSLHRPAWLAIIVSGCAASGADVDRQESNLETGIAQADPQLCPPGSIDSDGDQLCDAAETRFGTDLNNVDSDGDSLSDALEVNGYKLNGKVLDLKALGANPLHKDVFVYVDYLAEFAPTGDALQRVVDAFARSPVQNPDGTTGIKLRIDLATKPIAAAEAPSYKNITSVPQFNTLKNDHFDPVMGIAYHYAFFGQQRDSGTSSGYSLGIPATDFIVTLGSFLTQDRAEWARIQSGTFMHELGHNLGLHHGGLSETNADDTLYKPNYFSVMNYNYQMVGVSRDQVSLLDYSRVGVGAVEEQNLVELDAYLGAGNSSADDLAHYNNPRICVKRKINRRKDIDVCQTWVPLLGDAGRGLDFDRDKRIDQTRMRRTADLDAANGRRSVFTAVVDDWGHLTFDGGNVIGVDTRLPQRNVVDVQPTECMEADTVAEADDEVIDNTTPQPDETDVTTTPVAPTTPTTPSTSTIPSTPPTTPTTPTRPTTPTSTTPTTSTPSTTTPPKTTTTTPSTPATPGTPDSDSVPGDDASTPEGDDSSTDPDSSPREDPSNDPAIDPSSSDATTPQTEDPTNPSDDPQVDPDAPTDDPNVPPQRQQNLRKSSR